MKCVTFLDGSESKLGVVVADSVVDVFATTPRPQFRSMLALIEAGDGAWQEAMRAAARPAVGTVHPLEGVRLCAPLPLPQQIRDAMCFHKHIRQASIVISRRRALASGSVAAMEEAQRYAASFTIPDIHLQQPVYYKANRFAVAGPDEDILWPAHSRLMDFELELAIVIGRRGKDIPAASALDYVFGFTIFNDLSARDLQAVEMAGLLGPAKGKDFDQANVFGPCIVTREEIGDPQALRMIARVNGETWCDSSSATMHWTVAQLIAHVSRGETVYPGEIICTGTVGDGCGLEHDRYLQHGDVVELEIEKIGVLRNRILRS